MTTPVLIWVHGEALSPHNPALQAHPGAPAVFVFDDALLSEWGISLKRLVFMYECLLDMPVDIRRGEVVAELLACAQMHHAQRLITTASPSPRFAAYCQQVRRTLPVEVLEGPAFIQPTRPLDLKRFSRYWQAAQRWAFTPTNEQG